MERNAESFFGVESKSPSSYLKMSQTQQFSVDTQLIKVRNLSLVKGEIAQQDGFQMPTIQEIVPPSKLGAGVVQEFSC